MKRPMKWIITLTLLLFAVGVISSCSQKKTEDTGTSETTSEATPVAETTDTAGMDSMTMCDSMEMEHEHDDSADDSM